MKGDCDEYIGRDLLRRYRRTETPGKINTLLSDLLEKEDEIALYKNRLKELEAAFYYNLELISERDLEISVLEKQLRSETEHQEAIIRERDELEDLVKVVDEKKNRKIQQLETKLALKEDEMRELQRDNVNNVNALKKIIDNIKAQQEKKMHRLNNRYELQKKELIKNFQQEMEEKEKYYLFEIDNLTGKLEQVVNEKKMVSQFEKEYNNLKYHLEDMERLFQEKENYYLEEIRKLRKPATRKISREVQCGFTKQVIDRNVQVEPDKTSAECQTRLSEPEEQYKKKISFLEEQNEVLKCVIKEMKKNRTEVKAEEKESRCECGAADMMEKVNKKFEGEINNLKKILEEEKMQRREEEVAIQSLETCVTCLKDKLLMGLQGKLQQFSGEDNCNYALNHEMNNEIQVTLLEKKLNEKIEAVMTIAREEQQKVYEKLEEIKKECNEKIEKYLRPKKETSSENLLEKIRLEMRKLENKIENNLKNTVGRNLDKNHDKNSLSKMDLFRRKETPLTYRDMMSDDLIAPSIPRGVCFRNDLAKAWMNHKVENQLPRIKLREQEKIRKLRNDLAVR